MWVVKWAASASLEKAEGDSLCLGTLFVVRWFSCPQIAQVPHLPYEAPGVLFACTTPKKGILADFPLISVATSLTFTKNEEPPRQLHFWFCPAMVLHMDIAEKDSFAPGLPRLRCNNSASRSKSRKLNTSRPFPPASLF